MARRIHVPEYDRTPTVDRRGRHERKDRDPERTERSRIRRTIFRVLRADAERTPETIRMW